MTIIQSVSDDRTQRAMDNGQPVSPAAIVESATWLRIEIEQIEIPSAGKRVATVSESPDSSAPQAYLNCRRVEPGVHPVALYYSLFLLRGAASGRRRRNRNRAFSVLYLAQHNSCLPSAAMTTVFLAAVVTMPALG